MTRTTRWATPELAGETAEDTGVMIRRRVVAHGRVQGVGLRWECAEEAERLGVRGWVRNRADGTVEAVAEGDDEAVAQFVAWVREGASYARVTRMQIIEEPPQGLIGFRVLA